MLNIFYGDMKEAVYNTASYFEEKCQGESDGYSRAGVSIGKSIKIRIL